MRKIALILSLCMILGCFSGCGSEEAYVPTGNAMENATVATEPPVTAPGMLETEDRSYVLAYYVDDGFNPYLCAGFTNRLVFSLLYQGLFTVDVDYNVEPMLCKSYTAADDMKSHTFVLEPATFSDGSVLKAEDVVASLEAARESDVYEGRFDHIETVEEINGNTVKITTNCSFENLPVLLDIPILKKNQVEFQSPLGTGPYRLVQTAGGKSLQKRTNWWTDTELPVNSENIPLWAASDTTAIRDRFEFEDLGISYADPGAGSYVDYRCDYEVWDCETGIMLYLGCNGVSKVFSNPEVRAALTYAINREMLLEECYNGFGVVATLPASPNSPYYDKGLASQVKYEPERLKQAIMSNGLTGSSIKLLVNSSDSVRVSAAKMIANVLTECGLTVEILQHSTSYFRESVYAGNFDIYLGQTKLSANMDLSEFFAPYGDMSWGSMSNAGCYSMCLEALENIGNYYNLHQLVVQDGQLTPILFRTYAVYAERGLADDLAPARDNVFWYSIGKTLDEIMTIE